MFERFSANIAECPTPGRPGSGSVGQGADRAAAQGLLPSSFVDGCHFAPDVLTDLVLASILRPGG